MQDMTSLECSLQHKSFPALGMQRQAVCSRCISELEPSLRMMSSEVLTKPGWHVQRRSDLTLLEDSMVLVEYAERHTLMLLHPQRT